MVSWIQLKLLFMASVCIILQSLQVTANLEALALRSSKQLKANMADEGKYFLGLLDSSRRSHLTANSRKKRELMFPLELPKGLNMQFKWWIDLPTDTFARFFLDVQFAILIDAPYAKEFVHKQEKFPYREIWPEVYRPLLKVPDLIDTGYGIADEEEDRKDEILHRKKRQAMEERRAVYNILENFLIEASLPARACLLRTICEVAETPLQDDLLGKLVTAILKPSLSTTYSTGDEYDEYLTAEYHGTQTDACAMRYSNCPQSLFDVIPFIESNFVYK